LLLKWQMKQTQRSESYNAKRCDIDLLENEKFDRHQQNRAPSLQACCDGQQEAAFPGSLSFRR
jgi:hypothetical protein